MSTAKVNEKAHVEHHDHGQSPTASPTTSRADPSLENLTAANRKLDNPLRGIPRERLLSDVELFAEEKGLKDILLELRKGALVAQDPAAFESVDLLEENDKYHIRRETTHRYSQTWSLYYMVVMSSLAAAVQGMDESVINGAQIIYPEQFGIGGTSQRDSWLVGLVNSAPYLCCALIGCWITDPMNEALGRKKTIFVTCLISFLTCIWSAFTNTWWHLFIARFFLGFGIGPKSATVPIYSAECAPASIRGSLVMMWQMWTAFGIMIGDLIDVAFYFVPDHPHVTGLKWRLMLGSAGIPALIVCCQVMFAPESPRWLIGRGRYREAYNELARLRFSPVQAARDLYYIHVTLEAEKEIARGRNRLVEMFTVPRNRNATVASFIVMFGQQFCGVNVIAYYSSTVFFQSGFSRVSSLLSSFGFGLINFVFALPAVFTIDTFGRRNLLLFTFPWMAVCLLITGFSFWSTNPKGLVAGVSLGIYLFGIAYSPGEGPVPFTYSAEAFPLYIRELGMSFATATTWFFNFVLAITFPSLLNAFKPQGAFGFLCSLVLRALGACPAFLPMRTHAAYGLRQVPYGFKKFILRRKNVKPVRLYIDEDEGEVGETVGKQEIGNVDLGGRTKGESGLGDVEKRQMKEDQA
ncbi:MFS domain-containing protein [Mycena indigotica]|uniref:MFS domain-containing protein n=1 Tax=Mycena indigotica TaxID=2126181 RepID=A0A8H6VUW9_9AGAR|nr:MFS domain-containing protein [Mycena indigotica]KAF7289149.1 MFS domain-containing protein [Mycena indigotica]